MRHGKVQYYTSYRTEAPELTSSINPESPCIVDSSHDSSSRMHGLCNLHRPDSE
jgi:hypothetical protein